MGRDTPSKVEQFRELLKKVGSGTHTSEALTRAEAAAAMRMMLKQEATPAQIGAFLIAHRIRRPAPEELAGMLDACSKLGPHIAPIASTPVTVFGVPYDGRARTAPVMAVTALLLAAAGVPVLLHGGDRMPTKYGLPQVGIWQGLGVAFATLSLAQVRKVLVETGVGFTYLPVQFPQAAQLVPYRDEIGKRPPLATLELVWSPYDGATRAIVGFVHPPTEGLLRTTLALRGAPALTTVKGLEGSCDLARSRPGIVGVVRADGSCDRLTLHPHDHGLGGSDAPLEAPEIYCAQLRAVLEGKASALTTAAIWNGGFYLWHCGVCTDLETGFAKAEAMLKDGVAAGKCEQVAFACRDAIAS
ncbi:anthranilate phosphoribosyltransferase [Rubidibacter lacunae KORDI 51-2]|uniref:Anthranilate phosphoribosyltransferase n=1 Tax=Rubidibacter lacunae KORDI 51-2 TaxID=582515 RepID=U5DPY3_9CHRO|nr:anthranilate phosphoribosyltransferase family protein [Rubidibacter lacunae]ERN41760.1 anthranilate phosphoribosyltransferase [Rubidibacter lacunae KORDI 51-2]